MDHSQNDAADAADAADQALAGDRPAPALSTEVQELANLAVRAGLTPLVCDVEYHQFVVVLTRTAATATAGTNHDYLIAVNAVDQGDDLTMFGEPPADDPDGDASVWNGYTRIRAALTALLPEQE